MKYKQAEISHLAIGSSPLANAFAGTMYSDVINLRDYGKARFIVYGGVGATGTSTFTVEACDDIVPTNVSAVPFTYQQYTGDLPGTLTQAASTGFTCAAGNNRLITIEVDQEALSASGYQFVRLKSVEVTASAVLGGILVELLQPRSNGIVGNTVTS
jgi:hypothetical protein